MDESSRLLEMLIGQIDKRLTSIEQHMAGFHNAMDQLRGELKGEMAELRSELKGEMAELRKELKADMAELRVEGRTHLRWSLTAMFTLFGIATPLWMWLLSRIIK